MSTPSVKAGFCIKSPESDDDPFLTLMFRSVTFGTKKLRRAWPVCNSGYSSVVLPAIANGARGAFS